MNIDFNKVKPGDKFFGVGPHDIDLIITSKLKYRVFGFKPLTPNNLGGGWDGSEISAHWLEGAERYEPSQRKSHLPEWW